MNLVNLAADAAKLRSVSVQLKSLVLTLGTIIDSIFGEGPHAAAAATVAEKPAKRSRKPSKTKASAKPGADAPKPNKVAARKVKKAAKVKAPAKAKTATRAKASAEPLDEVVMSVLFKSSVPLGKSGIMAAAGLSDKDAGRVALAIGRLREKNRISMSGDRRGAVYAVANLLGSKHANGAAEVHVEPVAQA